MCGCGCKAGKLGMSCGSVGRIINQTPNGIVNMNRKAPDSMRHGGLNYEVVGDDYASDGTRESSQDVTRTFTNPLTNQAGALAPLTSERGQRLRDGANGVFIREMNPLMRNPMFKNNVGKNRAQSANNISVVASGGYDGILPLNRQPHINKPLPYL